MVLFISACVTSGLFVQNLLKYLLISDRSIQEAECTRLLYLPPGRVCWRSSVSAQPIQGQKFAKIWKACNTQFYTQKTTTKVVQKVQLEPEMEIHLAEENHTGTPVE